MTFEEWIDELRKILAKSGLDATDDWIGAAREGWLAGQGQKQGGWQPIETAPKSGQFLLAVWSGDWNNVYQEYRVHHARGSKNGPEWSMRGHYRTEEGGAYQVAGWMPLPDPPA